MPADTETSKSLTEVTNSDSKTEETLFRRDKVHDVTHIFTENDIFEFTANDLRGFNSKAWLSDKDPQPTANIQAVLVTDRPWSSVTSESSASASALAYGVSSTLLLVQLAQIGIEEPHNNIVVSYGGTGSAIFGGRFAHDVKETGFRFNLRLLSDSHSKYYAGSVGPCPGNCKNPSGTVVMTNDGSGPSGRIISKPVTIFTGTVLQKPEGKDVLGKCRDYLETAFNDPDTYFVPPPGPKAQDNQEGKKRKSTSD
ncbi:hypothetical protein EV361DRAFT_919121 [Lentinula raphanica]|nr:hypothetical protein EV361DRAFT_919121 [Lentinula raphanica]